MTRLRAIVLGAVGVLAATGSASAQTPVVVEYYHVDAVGSVRAVTNQSGQVVRRHDDDPFGQELPTSPSGTDRLRFTGKERDPESGLQYFGARYYASSIGRFTTIDPALDVEPALFNPQRWNRCAYAGNNPMRFNDPNGEDFWDFVNGVGNALKADFSLGVGRSTTGNSDFKIGQRVGDLLALVGSAVETVGGITTGSAGVAACGTGLGCFVGAPVGAAGATTAVHGVGMGVAAGVSLMSPSGFGGLKLLSGKQRAGIDEHVAKSDFLGTDGGKYNISVDDNGLVWLTPVKKGAAPPVETGLTLEQFRASYPKK